MPDARTRVAYIEHCTPVWPDIAARLRDELGWDPVYWVAPPTFGPVVTARFPGVIFHSRVDANHLVNPPELAGVRPAVLDETYLKSTADIQLIAMKMLDVIDSLDGFTLGERARFVRQRLAYWKAIIGALHPDVVLFPFSPHTVYDYLIQEICRSEGIRTAMFENPYPIDWATFFTMDSPHSGPSDVHAEFARMHADEDAPLPPTFARYLHKTRGTYGDALPWYMRQQLEHFPQEVAEKVFASDASGSVTRERRRWWPQR